MPYLKISLGICDCKGDNGGRWESLIWNDHLLLAAESKTVSLSPGLPDTTALELLKILFGKRERGIFNRWLWPWLITYKMGMILPASRGLGEISMKIFLWSLKYCTMHMERDFLKLLPVYWIHKRWSPRLTWCYLLFLNQRGPSKLPRIHENFGSFPTHWR